VTLCIYPVKSVLSMGSNAGRGFGLADGQSLLMVAHTLGEECEDGDAVIRIISARWVVREERKRYEDENG
jgi:uncharacterized DUF497 family protein